MHLSLFLVNGIEVEVVPEIEKIVTKIGTEIEDIPQENVIVIEKEIGIGIVRGRENVNVKGTEIKIKIKIKIKKKTKTRKKNADVPEKGNIVLLCE